MREANPMARRAFGDIPNLIGRDFNEIIHMLLSKDDAEEVVRIFPAHLGAG